MDLNAKANAELHGVGKDVQRLLKQSGPNATDQVSAICRVLNDTCKHDAALTQLFDARAGDHHLCKAIKDGIQVALELGCAHLRKRTPEVMQEWAICQLFNGIRGLLSCKPFSGVEEQQKMRATLKEFANELLTALPDSPIFLDGQGGRVEMDFHLLPYSQLLLGVLRTGDAGLADLSLHRDVLGQLLTAVAASRHAGGWDVQGMANALFAAGGLMQSHPALMAELDVHAAFKTLAQLIDESICDTHERRLWGPIDCTQARQGLQCLIRAQAGGSEDPVFSQVSHNLDRLQDEIVLGPPTVRKTPLRVAPQSLTRPDAGTAQDRGVPMPCPPVQGGKPAKLPGQPKAQAQPRAPAEPKARDPSQGKARRTRKPAPAKSDAGGAALWQRLAMKTTAKAVITEINRSEPHFLEKPHASTQELAKMLSLVAGADRQSTAAESAMQVLLQAAKQHVDAASASDEGLPMLLTALVQALLGSESCNADITASMQTICLKLAKKSSEQRSLAQIGDIVASLVPLLDRGDKWAALPLQRMTKAIARLGAAQLPAGADITSIKTLLIALAPALWNPGVTAFLKQLTACLDRVGVSASSQEARASALASIAVSLPLGSSATGAAVDLMHVLARDLRGPGSTITPESITTRQGRWKLVYSLLAPFWLHPSTPADAGDSGVEVRLRPPGDADPTVMSTFVSGALDAFQAGIQDGEFIIDCAGTPQLATPTAEGHFEWVVDKARDASCPWFERLSRALGAVDSALSILGDVNLPDEGRRWEEMFWAAITTCYMQLVPMGPEGVRAGLPQQPGKQDGQRLRLYANVLAFGIAEAGHDPFDNEQTKTTLMSCLDCISTWLPDESSGKIGDSAGSMLADIIELAPPRTLSDVIEPLVECLEQGDLAAMTRLSGAIIALDSKKFDARHLVHFGPLLPQLVQNQGGFAILHALTRRIVELEPRNSALLWEGEAARLLADIACMTEYLVDADESRIAFELMDAISSKCREKPVTWPKDWCKAWKLDEATRCRRFIFQLLRPHWLEEATRFEIPEDTGTFLARSFGYGRVFFNDPWTTMMAGDVESCQAATQGMYEAFVERGARCETDGERNNLLGIAAMLVLHAGACDVDAGLMTKCRQAMIWSIAECSDPVGFFDKLDARAKRLFVAASGTVAAQRHLHDDMTSDQSLKLKALELKLAREGIRAPTTQQIREQMIVD